MGKWYGPVRSVWRAIDYRLGSRRHKLKCDFRAFEETIHRAPEFYGELQQWAETAAAEKNNYERPERYEASEDKVVREGFRLRRECLQFFRGRCHGTERFMFHCPTADLSPAVNSIARNWAEGMEFLGIPVRLLSFGEDMAEAVRTFRPTVLLTPDSVDFLRQLDWPFLAEYGKKHRLRIGLSAIPGTTEDRPLGERLRWAKEHGIDFYYCYADLNYCKEEYEDFFRAGYPVISIPFSANPLHYYPVPDVKRDLDFVFLASVNMDKWNRYIPYLRELVKREKGILLGPGWKHYAIHDICPDRDRYLYARAKVGLNLHLDFQLKGANELNERTYMLAACGTPQLVDAPGLLPKHFDKDSFFIGTTPEEYNEQFVYILSHPEEAGRRALNAVREVFRKHTIFHRMEQFHKDVRLLRKDD